MMEDILRAALEELEAGRTCVTATVIEVSGHTASRPGAKLLVRETGETIGTVGGGALEKLCVEKARELIGEGESVLLHYALDEGAAAPETTSTAAPCGGKATIYYERLGGMPNVHLFGAGHIGSSLAYFLAPLAFRVSIHDDRTELLEALPERPRLRKQHLSPFEGALAASDFVVIATHSHDLDYEVAKTVLALPVVPRYVGIVSSRRKWEQFSRRLEQDIPAGFDRKRLFAPCGLSIASRDPREIALSIVAEILSVRDGVGPITHMKDRTGKA